jgi:broad specificity phosphatase PhoE
VGSLLLVRHGQTAWSRDSRHTGLTDVPLTPYGEQQARALAPVLGARRITAAHASPLQRATRTAVLAGVDAAADPDLLEWDNGGYEGRTTAEIREDRPDWWLWTDGVPPGDTPGEDADAVAARCRRVLDRVAPGLDDGDVALVAHGHTLRVLAAVWLGLPGSAGGLFTLEPATLCTLGTYRGHRVVETWNDAAHLAGLPEPADPQVP